MRESFPIQLLFEAESHVITVELTSGDSYRGVLLSAEENMNVRLAQAQLTTRAGSVSTVEHVIIRGDKIRFVVFPPFLRFHPMFQEEKEAVGNAK
ncbi:Ribonucleoprotein LSM domain eukaryotic/archaea-type [Perkinsela sp. CCAP 1560/4]|nr:Ribonucleoprotein LSM domain eukaryotic/archaea-type [Perkinsela sp. CCAP 1560/4]|eukprot:KNH05439.1 Ribonucleoprotein LSM domain eukaryotic/archaea-type [Perkinsela sp. CCAP 1560/4]